MYSQCCTTVTNINFGTFLSPHKVTLYPLAFSPLFALPPFKQPQIYFLLFRVTYFGHHLI